MVQAYGELVHINVDDALLCSSAFRGLGSVGRSSDRLVLMALATRLTGRFSIEASEALAVLFAIDQAISRGWMKVEFES